VEPVGTIPSFRNVDRCDARAIVEDALERGGGWLTPLDAMDLVSAFGIRVVPTFAACDAEDAADMAGFAEFPVALKAVGPEIVHKTESRAVILGLADREAVSNAYRELSNRLGDQMTSALVQPMVNEAVEMFAGATLDPTFGHVIVCGTGGTLVELLRDTSCRLHPLTDLTAHEMVESLRGAALLRGFRGAPPRDQAAFEDLLLRLSALLEACPEIAEVDLNPVMVRGRGAEVADVRVRIERQTPGQSRRRISY
jgi:acyl-CoA synthetase (NDP forming)